METPSLGLRVRESLAIFLLRKRRKVAPVSEFQVGAVIGKEESSIDRDSRRCGPAVNNVIKNGPSVEIRPALDDPDGIEWIVNLVRYVRVIVVYPLGELVVVIEGHKLPDSSGEITQPGSFRRKVSQINSESGFSIRPTLFTYRTTAIR